MKNSEGLSDLSEEQLRAIERFKEYHANKDAKEGQLHQLIWSIDDKANDNFLKCTCGAALHVNEPIYVRVEPRKPPAETINAIHKKKRVKFEEWMRASISDAAYESLYQSALVTLSDETFGQIRLYPSVFEMHFGLGMYLRNRFVHSGLLYCGIDPDNLSSSALSKLIRHCLPEFAEYNLVYDQLEQEPLYTAYRYCMKVRGYFPKEEFIKHYDILLEAEAINNANPYSILDDNHYDEWCEWSKKYDTKLQEYTIATLYEIWNFEKLRTDLGNKITDACEAICLAATGDDQTSFMPSEIAYIMAGASDEMSMKAFDWAVEDYRVVDYLPDSLFKKRGLVLRAVALCGDFLERATAYQDDDEVVLAAVTNSPHALTFASSRLQNDRKMLIVAASNAQYGDVFREECMAKYNDDDELVRLALMANGANVKDASTRVRNDINFGLLAIQNKRDIYPDLSYEGLSDELKKDRRIVEEVAQTWDSMPSEFPPKEYADDDAVAALLSVHEDHYCLYGLSRRLKERYMTEDELEKWGFDPYWWDDDWCDDEDEEDE
ncbi:MAG: DUF4116 domain-containing protein [Atopobium sp.]|uniref:DUF4116 domain-containing protein n=1 Tax=Atopobium sp. TaxID=1872650 RepID=UPI002A8180AA|nr:DUF4116 domain-containing protein [Atopobium sp.]MDY4522203.1 DUF4116 domain-containing protein [Atopobium sp.]